MSSNLTLDMIHHHLDAVEVELDELKSLDQSSKIHSTELSALIDACESLVGWTGYGDDITKSLAVPPKLMNKFTMRYGDVLVRDATVLAAKVRSYLKRIEGEVEGTETESAPEPQPPVQAPSTATNFDLSGWQHVPQNIEVKKLISRVSITLDSVIQIAKASNLPDSEKSLTEIERAALIAILETALFILKAPLTNKGFFKNVGRQLKQVAAKTAQNKAEQALGHVVSQAIRQLQDYLGQLPNS
jgi:hypothetical protein